MFGCPHSIINSKFHACQRLPLHHAGGKKLHEHENNWTGMLRASLPPPTPHPQPEVEATAAVGTHPTGILSTKTFLHFKKTGLNL